MCVWGVVVDACVYICDECDCVGVEIWNMVVGVYVCKFARARACVCLNDFFCNYIYNLVEVYFYRNNAFGVYFTDALARRRTYHMRQNKSNINYTITLAWNRQAASYHMY